MDAASKRCATSESTLLREIERCRQEIFDVEEQLRAGPPDVAGLFLALADWSAELKILERGGDAKLRTEPAQERGNALAAVVHKAEPPPDR